jgi:hypothetical protein
MTKVLVQAGVELEYETIGSPDDPIIAIFAPLAIRKYTTTGSTR